MTHPRDAKGGVLACVRLRGLAPAPVEQRLSGAKAR
jgi:hypothetical protein